MIIPSDRKWTQTNSGEVFGVLNATKNINFDQEGYAKLARRATAVIHDLSNFNSVKSISYLSAASGTGYYFMTSGDPFYMVAPTQNSAATSLTGAGHVGGLNFDGIIWQGRWYISQATTFAYYTGSAWTTGLGSITSGNPHPLCVFESLNSLCIGDANTVKLYDTSHVLTTTLTIPANFEIRWIRYRAQNVYIGTKNTAGGEAYMFVWNGSGTTAQGSYPVAANWAFAGEVYQSSIVILTSRGQLLRFNGGGFDPLANLPLYYTPYAWYGGTGFTQGKCEQRGMVVDGNVLYISLDGSLADSRTILPNQPSGIWVFDPKVGLYHKAGVAWDKNQSITTISVDTSTDIFTGSSYTSPTGTLVFYTGTASAGLITSSFYYLIRLSSTTFKLASSYANAIAGTAIDITAAGSSEAVYLHDDTSFGRTDGNGSIQMGAIALVNDLDTSISTYREEFYSQVIFGVNGVNNNTFSATKSTLQSLTRGENRGYITTQKIWSDSVLEKWQKAIEKYGRVFQTSDKIVVKYRSSDLVNHPVFINSGGATWIGTTSFSTTVDLSSVSIGEEVEVIDGSGSGWCTHISAIQAADANAWIVTVDEANVALTAGDKSTILIQNWKKIGTASSTTINSLLDTSKIDKQSKWVQLKIELRGHSEPYMELIQIINTPEQTS